MNLVQNIQKLRDQIQQLKEEIEWVTTAPVTREEFKERVLGWVNDMAARAEQAARGLNCLRSPNPHTVNGADLLGVETRVTSIEGKTGVTPIEFSIAPQLTWLLGDAIKETLLAKVEAMDYVPGLPMDERPARLAQLGQELRALEEKEEALICEAEADNQKIYRRADADPAVVLSYDPQGTMIDAPPGKVRVSGAPLPAPNAAFTLHQATQSMVAAQYDAINATARMNQQVAAFTHAMNATSVS